MRRRTVVVAVLLLALSCLARPACAATAPGDYSARLQAALAAVREAERTSGAARSHALAVARALLPSVVPVQLGAVRVAADLGAVRDDLTAGRLARAAARLSALRAALSAPAAHLAAPDARRLARLDAILNGPPFTTPPNLFTAIGQFFQRLVENTPLGAVIDFINRLLHAALGSAADSPAVPIVAGLIVAVALVFALSRSFGTFVPQAQVDAAEGVAGLRLDAAGARARAATLAAAGEFREAARYLFLSTLLALDEAGRLRIDEATGNRDVLRQARAVPRLAERLTPVVRGFELFWFGHLPVTREDYERYRQLNERVLEIAR